MYKIWKINSLVTLATLIVLFALYFAGLDCLFTMSSLAVVLIIIPVVMQMRKEKNGEPTPFVAYSLMIMSSTLFVFSSYRAYSNDGKFFDLFFLLLFIANIILHLLFSVGRKYSSKETKIQNIISCLPLVGFLIGGIIGFSKKRF